MTEEQMQEAITKRRRAHMRITRWAMLVLIVPPALVGLWIGRAQRTDDRARTEIRIERETVRELRERLATVLGVRIVTVAPTATATVTMTTATTAAPTATVISTVTTTALPADPVPTATVTTTPDPSGIRSLICSSASPSSAAYVFVVAGLGLVAFSTVRAFR